MFQICRDSFPVIPESPLGNRWRHFRAALPPRENPSQGLGRRESPSLRRGRPTDPRGF